MHRTGKKNFVILNKREKGTNIVPFVYYLLDILKVNFQIFFPLPIALINLSNHFSCLVSVYN